MTATLTIGAILYLIEMGRVMVEGMMYGRIAQAPHAGEASVYMLIRRLFERGNHSV
jgi:hypothetical protein